MGTVLSTTLSTGPVGRGYTNGRERMGYKYKWERGYKYIILAGEEQFGIVSIILPLYK